MKNIIILSFALLFLFPSFSTARGVLSDSTSILPPYDHTADPFIQLSEGVANAQHQGKRILLEVGGEWCKWCHYLDAFLQNNPDIFQLLQEHYVMVKINFSKENDNEKFLSQYPTIKGYPHFFVLSSDGQLLHSQDTGELESGKSYSREKFMEFLESWKP